MTNLSVQSFYLEDVTLVSKAHLKGTKAEKGKMLIGKLLRNAFVSDAS